KPRSPAIEPVIHHLLGERKLPLGRRVAAQVAPDDLRLVEHGVFHFGVRAPGAAAASPASPAPARWSESPGSPRARWGGPSGRSPAGACAGGSQLEAS